MPEVLFSQIPIDDLIERIKVAIVPSTPPPGDSSLRSHYDDQLQGDDAASKYIGCSRNTITQLKKNGEIPFTKVGSRYIYYKSQLEIAFMDQKRRFGEHSKRQLPTIKSQSKQK